MGTLVVRRLKHFTPETHLVKMLPVTGSTIIDNKVQGGLPFSRKISKYLVIFSE